RGAARRRPRRGRRHYNSPPGDAPEGAADITTARQATPPKGPPTLQQPARRRPRRGRRHHRHLPYPDELRAEVRDGGAQLGVLLLDRRHASTGVDDGGVVLAAEAQPDLGEARAGEL